MSDNTIIIDSDISASYFLSYLLKPTLTKLQYTKMPNFVDNIKLITTPILPVVCV